VIGWSLLVASALAVELSEVEASELVRVDDPSFPGAVATSGTGAVLTAPPPPGTRWRHESVPELDLIEVEPTEDGFLRAGSIEAIDAMNVGDWHARGVKGAGVKVAVFDLQWFGAGYDPTELGEVSTHDCWASPSCEVPMENWRARFSYEEGSHGYACAETIRDIAPEAELYLVRVNGETTLENAAQWAIREQIDLVSMSLSFFNNSFYDGSGPISAQAEAMARGGVLLVTSAGNYAESHWRGRLTDGDMDGRADFDGLNGLWIYHGSGTKTVYVNWNQHSSCGVSDLWAQLRSEDGDILDYADDEQAYDGDNCEPVERINAYVRDTQWTFLEVGLGSGVATDVDIDIYASTGDIDGAVPEGSITDPGASPYAVAVAAIDGVGYLDNDVEYFSSWGVNGKPEIGGPDGLTTTVYGVRGFFGTSASTPATTAALALVMSEDPSLTAWDAVDILSAWAIDGDGTLFSEPSPKWGAGKARLSLEPTDAPCGRRPLLLPLVLFPVAMWRRRRR
jgi:subtilisin family serine protease